MTARRVTLITMLAGAALVAAPALHRPDVRVIWNASASVPVGLYRIVPAGKIAVTDLAVVMPPDELAAFLDERGYLPRGLPLIKRVLALSGTTVCRSGAEIVAYGTTYGEARALDTRGRPLPVWQGCRTLLAGEAFFMNWDSPDSFDSRYFGPLPVSALVGRAVPVWSTDDPDPATESFREPVSDEP
ncbi:S26 family signal peptidase [Aliihoeflea sp. 2WW]|uniref:S26 family signal peptidase n=1 Tax=Aliihoeflea sp. 2WW TaxID=1381123 RepID=UPI00046694CA|nr:S26 family signal peptidase [Aliihoeflea sp. 2WW]